MIGISICASKSPVNLEGFFVLKEIMAWAGGNAMRAKRLDLSLSLKILVVGIVASFSFFLIYEIFKPIHDLPLRVDGILRPSMPGFQTWPTPRSFDPPGTVFRLDGESFIHIAQLPVQNSDVGSESIPSQTLSGTSSGSLLGYLRGQIEGGLGLEGNTTYQVTLNFSDVHRWRADSSQLEQALNSLQIPSGSRGPIYVVREAISVRSIQYEVSFHQAGRGSASLEQAQNYGRGQIAVSSLSNGRYEINQSFEEPHYVFYLASQVRRLSGIDQSRIILIDPPSELRWIQEIHPAGD